MIIANVEVNAVYAKSSNCLPIPKGIAGAMVQFSFSSDWDNLEKVIVFRGKSKVLGNLMADESAELPQELTKEIGVKLFVGVYGVNSEKTVAIPTLWADLGIVRYSADPSGAPAADPEFAPWVEIRKDMGSLADLETDEKSSIVKAINEVNSKAGNSGGNVNYGAENAGKLLYVGADGFATVLALGAGLAIENGVLILTGGSGQGILVTDDGNGNVTVTNVTVTDDGEGNVSISGVSVTDDGDGNATIG